MEEAAGSPAAEAEGPAPLGRSETLSPHRTPPHDRATTLLRSRVLLVLLTLLPLAPGCAPSRPADLLAHVKTTGKLVYGSDKEGGGPYVYPDPDAIHDVTGFEVELMKSLAADLGAKAEFSQGQWDRLLQNLDAAHVDMVVNGYEWTEPRARDYLASRPYYVYQLQLLAPEDGPIRSWDDLKAGPGPGGRKWKVGVLTASAPDTYAQEQGGPHVEVVRFDGATDAMTATSNKTIDATLQDLPAATFYRDHYPKLRFAGEPVGRGHYVMYFRKGDEPLRDQVDRGLARRIASGELRSLYERYGIWNEAQAELASFDPKGLKVSTAPSLRGFALVLHYAPLLLEGAKLTVLLSITAMPLAMLIGLFVALGRLYGPAALRVALTVYVEILRGTPLMLQLYVLMYLLKLEPLTAAVLGLAVNYSAYEAEIYRAGLQAIPVGQMEAALALGMSRPMALRRVIVPQAVRIVLPPVTNDFIAMFKDTSVCSAITLIELTKQYSILANHTNGFVEFALATAALYMAMSLPLSWFSRWSERRLGASGPKGVL